MLRIHGKCTAPLETIFVLWHDMHVTVPACISIGTIVDFIWLKNRMHGRCHPAYVMAEGVHLGLSHIGNLADMGLGRNRYIFHNIIIY